MKKYSLASRTWDEAELSAIQEVIESDMFSMGEKVAQYERDFAEQFGSKYSVMVSSGSTANLLMIAALFYTKQSYLQSGDEVLVPAVSWSTTYFPLQQYGLKVVFVDVDIDTLNMDLTKLEAAITPRTKAIFTVNLLGNTNDYGAIKQLIDGKNITLLEDNCESMGATYNEKQCGTYGLMGSYSSFFSHHMATMEGGCIVTDNEELYHVLLCLRAHGWTRNLPKFNQVTGEKSDDPFEESFKFALPGYNLRPVEMSGAIGMEQLKKLPSFVEQRQKNGQYFQTLFHNHPYIAIQKEIGTSSWFGFALILKPDAPFTRGQLVHTFKQHGVECRPIVTGNFLTNPVMEYFDYRVAGDVNNAEYIDKQGLFVGNHHYDLSAQLDVLLDIVDKVSNR